MRILTVILCLAFQSFYAQQGTFKPGWTIGVNTSQIGGDGVAGFNEIGLTGGGFVYSDFNKKWRAQFEINYIEKGSRRPSRPKQGIIGWAINLHYIEIPVLAIYKWKKFKFELGPSYAFLFRQVKRDIYGTDPVPLTSYGPFKQHELGYVVGVAVPLGKKWLFNWRHGNSITPIAGSIQQNPVRLFSFIGGSYNTGLSFTLKYSIQGKSQ
ncbi:MAG: PorT family protein [Flavobacteriales bacterium]|nr:PorT family protein [Flavobacteriales bacterium]